MNNIVAKWTKRMDYSSSHESFPGVKAGHISKNTRVKIINNFDELTTYERDEWNSISANQSIYTPFQSLFWNETWWSQFGEPSRLIRKDLHILTLYRDDEIIAFFPMLRQSLYVAGLPVLRYVQPLGGDGNLTELRTGIVREGFERAAYAALIHHFQNHDRNWEVITLPAAPGQAEDVYDAVSVGHPMIPVIEGFSIPLTDDWDSFRSGLKRNIKESIRKCHNSFRRDGIEPEFICLSDSAAIRKMLPEFYRLHAMRAAHEGGIHHRNLFQADDARRFLDRLAGDTSASGLRLFLLMHGDRLIAARLGFETAQDTYLYYSGYDLEYARYSVMTRLVIDVIRRSIESGRRRVHLSFGRDVSKTRWSPQEAAYKWNLMFRKSVRGYVASLVLEALMRLKRRGHPASNGLPGRDDQNGA